MRLTTRPRRLAAGGLTGLGLTLLAASPAAAHDELVGTTPAASAHVNSAPKQVVLRFAEPPGALGTQVSVKDSAGKDWAAGKPVRSGSTVTTSLRSGAANGSYAVSWRVVSDDGHPVSGTFAYTVSGAGGASPSSSSVSTPDTSTTNDVSSRPESAQASRDSKLLTGILVVFLLVVLGGLAALLMNRQRR